MKLSEFLQWFYDNWHGMVDTTSVTIAIGTLFDLMPPTAAFLSVVWLCIRIYETATVQRWIYGGPNQILIDAITKVPLLPEPKEVPLPPVTEPVMVPRVEEDKK